MKYFQLLHKIKENVNECPKGISLGTIFRTIYGKMIKQLIFLTTFYISHENSVKNFPNMVC